MRRMIGFAVVLFIAGVALLSSPVGAEAIEGGRNQEALKRATETIRPELLPDGSRVWPDGTVVESDGTIYFSVKGEAALRDSHVVSLAGRRDGETCVFELPELRLEADQSSILWRELMRDGGNCVVKYEVGVPEDGVEADGLLRDALDRPHARSASSAGARMRIWWEDWINHSVSEVTAHVQTTVNWGNCVYAGSGWETHDWAETGWSMVSNSHWNGPRIGWCTDWASNNSQEHHNHTFCWPKNVHTHFPDTFVGIHVNGYAYGGNQNASYVSHHGWTWVPCFPLQLNAQLSWGS
ncbi:MAG: hypothetical protein P6D49_00385 [Acidimicrobiales bacterium]|nr:hypothetical protein [Acidimicrobiales bacterium]